LNQFVSSMRRRKFLGSLTLSAGALWTPGVFAEELVGTPKQTEGPFYPDNLPLDTDNDLIIINDSLSPAVGEITHLRGRILDRRGNPIKNAQVEIWQVDSQGVYLHSRSSHQTRLDTNFQGFGRFLTASDGGYYFRTIRPVPYGQSSSQRAPHIHFAVYTKGKEKFTTQCYVKDEPLNNGDFILNSIRDQKARDSIIIDFTRIEESRAGELKAQFDIVLGSTPAGK